MNLANKAAELESRFVTVEEDGRPLNIHYLDTEAGDECVVLLHGSGPGASGLANFSRNIDPFAQAGFRVLVIDAPGWSKSDSIVCGASRSHLNARVMRAVLDELNIEKCHFIGNSMGGHTAVAIALEEPSRVGKLVLMGGGTGGASPFVNMPTEGIKLLQNLYRDPTIENLKKMMSIFVFDTSDLTEELFEIRLASMLSRKDHLDNFVESLRLNPKQFPDVSYRLGEIDSEALIIWGRNDCFVPMDTGLRLVAGIRNSELHIFNQCGHWVQWEYAEKFNRMVIDFLKDQ